MIKENLYCIPYEKRVLRSSKGISYHCERESYDKNNIELKSSKSPKIKPKNKSEKCDVCGKEFKDTRSMKIHKTKKNHHEIKPQRQFQTKSKSKSLDKKNNMAITNHNKDYQNKKRNRSYSLSPYEKRAIKAFLKEAQ